MEEFSQCQDDIASQVCGRYIRFQSSKLIYSAGKATNGHQNEPLFVFEGQWQQFFDSALWMNVYN